jgi:CRP-like cAMP-binding protein
MDKLALLRKSEMFHELKDTDLRIVEAMAEQSEVIAGQLICKQGQLENRLYVVEDGTVAILLETSTMQPRQVQAVGRYESFAWSAMVDPYVCTASVKAVTDTKLLTFRADSLRDLCVRRPDIGLTVYLAVARLLAKRLRQSYLQLIGIADDEALEE